MKKLRLVITALAIGIGVTAALSLSVVSRSLQSSAIAILRTGRADFTVAQKGVSDLVNSNIDASVVPEIASFKGVASVTGVLISTARLNAANSQFLEIGIKPADLRPFGVRILAGRPFAASAKDELLLGWRAADNLGLWVGSHLDIGGTRYRVVGIYSTGQALGDTGSMLPLAWFQTVQRQPGLLSLLFVRTSAGASIPAVQARVDAAFPQLATIRTLAQFGRADRSLALINTATGASEILAVVIGAIVVLSAMSMSFIERIREFGVLATIGWPPVRVAGMLLAEALVIGVIGAGIGILASVAGLYAAGRLTTLGSVLQLQYEPVEFVRALYVAAAMCVLGAVLPAVRAAAIAPLEALRHE